MTSRALLAVVLLGASVTAQVAPGDIGATGFSTSSFGVVHPGSPTSAYNVGSFQGTGSATSQWILWDPANPQSFIVGGFGFVGRATVTGPSSATYSLLTNGVGQVGQLSFDAAGMIVVADTGTDQVRSVHPVTGVVTDLSIGTQPWGTSVNAGAVDPNTGDVVVGNSGGLYRLPFGATTGVQIVTGLGGFVSGVTFDPLTGDAVATVLTINRIVRVTPGGVVTDLVTPGTVASPNAIDVDLNGDYVIGGTAGQIFRVPNAGGSATLIGTNTAVSSNISGVSVVRGAFTIAVNPALGGHDVVISNVPTGTLEGWTFASADVSLPAGAGPVLGISPDALTIFIFNAFPTATLGNLFHWTWSSPAPGFFPGVPFFLPAGTVPPGATLDLIALAVNSGGFVASPPTRVTF